MVTSTHDVGLFTEAAEPVKHETRERKGFEIMTDSEIVPDPLYTSWLTKIMGV